MVPLELPLEMALLLFWLAGWGLWYLKELVLEEFIWVTNFQRGYIRRSKIISSSFSITGNPPQSRQPVIGKPGVYIIPTIIYTMEVEEAEFQILIVRMQTPGHTDTPYPGKQDRH